PFSRGLFESYKKISRAIGFALEKIGISFSYALRKDRNPALDAGSPKNASCFQSLSFGEISVGGRKIVGSAQRRWPEGLLQQGSIPFSINHDETVRIFGISSDATAVQTAAGLKDFLPDLASHQFKRSLIESFEETFCVHFAVSSPARHEIVHAEESMTRKYMSCEWNFGR
ncbi:MAG: hypothetical protein AB1442_17890, partial [Nitrospirota bacterium]